MVYCLSGYASEGGLAALWREGAICAIAQAIAAPGRRERIAAVVHPVRWSPHGAHHGGPAWSIEEDITESQKRRGASSWVELNDATSAWPQGRRLTALILQTC